MDNKPYREPFGYTFKKMPHVCPNCFRALGEGYSCPECADDYNEYYLAVPESHCFMIENLRAELFSGREGRNELFDNENLLKAYNNAVYDYATMNHSSLEGKQLFTRKEIFRREILVRMNSGPNRNQTKGGPNGVG